MDELPWRVLHVVANHERRVAQHLQARLLDHYLPLFQVDSRWTDRTVRIEKPLFPGYVFVRFTAQARLAALTIPGVLRVVGDDRNGFVPADEVARIRAALAQGLSLRPHPPIRQGTRVQVRTGIFAAVEGVVGEMRGDCTVVLSVTGVENCFSLQMPIDNLTVLNSANLPESPGTGAAGRSSAARPA